MKKYIHLLTVLFVINTGLANQQDQNCLNDNLFQDKLKQLESCKTLDLKQLSTETRIEINFKIAKLEQNLQNYKQSNAALLNMEQQGLLEDTNFNNVHHWLIETGINHYYLSDYSQALHYFTKALDLAEVQQNLQALALSYNSLGIVFKAQSRFYDALNAYQKSLKIRETLDNKVEIGSTLYNIGNVYVLIEKFDSAIKYYQRALDLYLSIASEDFDITERVIHIKDRMAQSLSELGKHEEAVLFLKELMADSAQLENKEFLLFEPYLTLTNIYLKLNQPDLALETVNKTVVTHEIGIDQKLLRIDALARIFLTKQQYVSAEEQISQGLELSKSSKSNEYITSFLLLMSELKSRIADYQAAYNYKTQFIDAQESILKQKYDTGIKYLENEIELTVQQKNLAILQKNSLLQELKLKKQRILVLTSIMFGMLLFLFIIWYVRKKKIERKKLLKQINYHKQKLNELDAPQEQLDDLFKKQTDPIVCINSFNIILFANQAFCDLFNTHEQNITGLSVDHTLPDLALSIDVISYNTRDLPEQQSLEHRHPDNSKSIIWLSTLISYDNCLVLSFQTDGNTTPSPTQTYQYMKTINQIDEIVTRLNELKNENIEPLNSEIIALLDNKLQYSSLSNDDLSLAYRQSLTRLMESNLEIWRKVTQGDRITLAEQSGVWKVTIDDGRLRTRALDRYLSLKSLPKSPRWRAVVKTSHYILSECSLSPQQREFLNNQLEVVMQNLKVLNSSV